MDALKLCHLAPRLARPFFLSISRKIRLKPLTIKAEGLFAFYRNAAALSVMTLWRSMYRRSVMGLLCPV